MDLTAMPVHGCRCDCMYVHHYVSNTRNGRPYKCVRIAVIGMYMYTPRLPPGEEGHLALLRCLLLSGLYGQPIGMCR